MSVFLRRIETVIEATIVAKVVTCILILSKILSPPPFPFFQVHWLLTLSLMEFIVILCLQCQRVKVETKLTVIYALGWLFGSIHLVFQAAKITSCPCLGMLTAYDTFLGLLARFSLLVYVGYMIIGSSLYLAIIADRPGIKTSY